MKNATLWSERNFRIFQENWKHSVNTEFSSSPDSQKKCGLLLWVYLRDTDQCFQLLKYFPWNTHNSVSGSTLKATVIFNLWQQLEYFTMLKCLLKEYFFFFFLISANSSGTYIVARLAIILWKLDKLEELERCLRPKYRNSRTSFEKKTFKEQLLLLLSLFSRVRLCATP